MPKRNLIWTVAVLAAAGVTALLTRQAATPGRADPNRPALLPVQRVELAIEENYYRPVTPREVLRGSVRGMIEALDEFSSYVPPEKVETFNRRLDGQVTGTGLCLEGDGPDVRVVGALSGSPASRLDVHRGWRVVRAGGRDASGLSAEEIAGLLDAPAQRPVAVVVEGTGGRQEQLLLPRQRFALETVVGHDRTPEGAWDYFCTSQPRIGCVRIKEFVDRTPEHFQRAMRELSGAAGVVLDLRDNPGGSLEAGYAVANLFLRRGAVFTKVGRGRTEVHEARGDGTLPYFPMVVLVNGGSASAAELVAGALRLHDRAVLVGTRTRGKGFVQSLLPLGDGLGQMNLTTAEFFVGTPRHGIRVARSGDRWGIDPHVELPVAPYDEQTIRRLWLRAEAVYPPGENASHAPRLPTWRRQAGAAAAALPVLPPALQADPQLACAVELLSEPERVERILSEAAAARRRAATAPAATAPADANAAGRDAHD